jgi:uncharacterized membrane protein YeaQ/YmgE (transglycosylase-associated protein family)
MTLLDLIGWLIVGGIAGWLAGMFMGRGGYGVLGDIIVGIIGAFVGGWLAALIFGNNIAGDPWYITIPIAFIGAVIVIWIVRMVTQGRSTV